MAILTTGDFWTFPADYRCITTNGVVKPNGELVMGKGIALEAKRRYPSLPKRLGNYTLRIGVHVYAFGDLGIISFPTKYHWKDKSDINLITQSCNELLDTADILENYHPFSILLPRVGCGNGGLDWKEVSKVVFDILNDNRFIIIEKPKMNSSLEECY